MWMVTHSVAWSRSLVWISVSALPLQTSRWRNPVVANATGVPNTTSIRSGWARSWVMLMTWRGAWCGRADQSRACPWDAPSDVSRNGRMEAARQPAAALESERSLAWTLRSSPTASATSQPFGPTLSMGWPAFGLQVIGAQRPGSGAVWECCLGGGRGGQERDHLAGDLPGGVAGQPVAGARDQREAGVADPGGRGAHVAGWDEPVVLTRQQQRRAADGGELPGEVGAGPGPQHLVLLEGRPCGPGVRAGEQGADLPSHLVADRTGPVEHCAQAGAQQPVAVPQRRPGGGGGVRGMHGKVASLAAGQPRADS